MHPDTLKRLVRERFFSPRIWSVSVTGDFQGSTPAEVIDETAIPRLIEHLLDPSRTRPVVAVTTRHREPLVDVKALVEAVARRARVVLLTPGEATDALVEGLPDRLGVFGGACRIWWPGLTSQADPMDHPLVWVRPGAGESAVRRIAAEMDGWSSTPATRPGLGDDVEGTVVAVDRNGATIDIGGGLLAYAHRSHLTREGVQDPLDVVRVGQLVRARVGRITDSGDPQLDLGPFQGDAWAIFADEAKPGDVVRGRALRLLAGGSLLMEVLPGVAGVVPTHLLRDEDVPAEGAVVAVRVVSVDPRAKRCTLSLRDAPLGADGALPLRLMIGGPVFLAHDDAGAEEAASEVDRLRAQVARLEEELASAADQIAQIDEERSRLRSELRAARERARESRLRPEEPAVTDDEASFLTAVRAAYERLYQQADRERYPLGEVRLGPAFLESVRTTQGIDVNKIVEVVAHIAADRAHEIPGIQAHPWRTGEGGAPQRQREDGAKGWRAALQINTPSARRIHYWVLPSPDGRVVELDEVGVHDQHI